MKKAVFAGTFDPPTLGHLELIKKAMKVCDQLIIAVSFKPTKQSVFSETEKIEMLKKIAPKAEIAICMGLIVDFAKEKNASFLIRGLRSLSDFEAEFQMANANRLLAGIETIFFMSDNAHSQISSSLIREIAYFKGSLKQFVPAEIEPMVRQKFA